MAARQAARPVSWLLRTRRPFKTRCLRPSHITLFFKQLPRVVTDWAERDTDSDVPTCKTASAVPPWHPILWKHGFRAHGLQLPSRYPSEVDIRERADSPLCVKGRGRLCTSWDGTIARTSLT
ncbi:hypothetical protein M413DRAFT_443486 [Hebeloma cylindrosporum]|uniref:Uncharacterized protein n=1 Tax=Hebeloma cylindrosporum TaxID=76867 RepID=A0A0C3CHC0_HEBCY|nr:hypothetical protein M413DRAFT_443486 [Hebeloma cylindrosporum h7]